MHLIFIHWSKLGVRLVPCIDPEMDSRVKETSFQKFCFLLSFYGSNIKV